jgi:hypothetical protein
VRIDVQLVWHQLEEEASAAFTRGERLLLRRPFVRIRAYLKSVSGVE